MIFVARFREGIYNLNNINQDGIYGNMNVIYTKDIKRGIVIRLMVLG
jgi:hypothetical protein